MSDKEILEGKIRLRIDEVGSVLRRSRRTVYRMIQNGDLPAIRKNGRYLVTSDVVRGYLGLEN